MSNKIIELETRENSADEFPLLWDNGMNPDYEKLGEIAKQTVIQTMFEGEKSHLDGYWKGLNKVEQSRRIEDHARLARCNNIEEDHIAHAMTRCAMIKFLEVEHDT
jgi:hypothetical protein